jgi:hypothetical protein
MALILPRRLHRVTQSPQNPDGMEKVWSRTTHSELPDQTEAKSSHPRPLMCDALPQVRSSIERPGMSGDSVIRTITPSPRRSMACTRPS